MSFDDAISGTIVVFEEGDMVTSTVIEVDQDGFSSTSVSGPKASLPN